jgi:hypothetical protein
MTEFFLIILILLALITLSIVILYSALMTFAGWICILGGSKVSLKEKIKIFICTFFLFGVCSFLFMFTLRNV